jgi:N-acetylglucosaminyldiphosphoundecaprenol N-acetyl-beta-D-mannosaminyltransferase
VIYNPVIGQDFHQQSQAEPPHPWLAEKICPVFIFVGRLSAQKDVFTLLAALQMLLKRCKGRLILLGDGEDEASLRRDAIRRGIAHAVAFAGFQINPLPWIRHADALVSSSRYEGLGNAIVEALACGTRVIATDCPHRPSEVLLEGELGVLVPVGDAEAMADAMAHIETAWVDPAKLRARAASFTAAACAEAHLALFRRIMVGRGRIVHALGMDLSPLSVQQVVNAIMQEPGAGGPRILVTPNLDHVRLLRRPDFAAAYATAHLVCPDGLPVLLYARLRGLKLRARVTGCEVFGQLMRHPGLRLQRLFLVVESTTTETAARAWAAGLGIADRITIAVAPPELMSDASAQNALVRRICEAGPTILVMTLGAPVSEVFVHNHRHALPPCWALCLGQALRVELQLAQRAPLVWQQLGLEWLWRLRHEPRRLLGRYVRDLAWFPVAVWRDISGREPVAGG